MKDKGLAKLRNCSSLTWCTFVPKNSTFPQERRRRHPSAPRYARNGDCAPFSDIIVLDSALPDPKHLHCTHSKKRNGARWDGVWSLKKGRVPFGGLEGDFVQRNSWSGLIVLLGIGRSAALATRPTTVLTLKKHRNKSHYISIKGADGRTTLLDSGHVHKGRCDQTITILDPKLGFPTEERHHNTNKDELILHVALSKPVRPTLHTHFPLKYLRRP